MWSVARCTSMTRGTRAFTIRTGSVGAHHPMVSVATPLRGPSIAPKDRGVLPAVPTGAEQPPPRSAPVTHIVTEHSAEPEPRRTDDTARDPLDTDELRLIDAYWRAANYLSVGQIYLLANPLLAEPLTLEHVKPRLLGHWGTTPGLNFIYAHLNRVIRARDLDVLCLVGPGHGGPGAVANAWLEGTYSELYADVSQDARGMARL